MNNKTRFSALALAVVMMLSLLSAYPAFLAVSAEAPVFNQDFYPDPECGDESAKLNVVAPTEVNVGEEFEMVLTWYDITYTNDYGETPASIDVYFLIDTRYIVYTGFKGIDGVEMTDLENMCSGPEENETFEDGYMQPLQVAVAIKTDAARAACDGSFVLRVGLKAIAEGTTDPAEWTSCMLGSYPTGIGYTVVADVDNANGAEFGWTVKVVDPSSAPTEPSVPSVPAEDFNQNFYPDPECGDESAKLNVVAPSQVTVGEEFEMVLTWYDITYTNDYGETPASIDVYFLIDTRYIVYTGFKGIDGVEMTDLENMCSGPEENETFEDGYMQPLQVAVAIKTDAARAACDGSFVLRVGLKAIAEGTTDPAEWTSCMLGSYPTGVGYTVIADVDNANGAEFGWTVNVVGEGSGDSSEEDSSVPSEPAEDFNQNFYPDPECGDESAKLNVVAPSQVTVGDEFEMVFTWYDITYTNDYGETPASIDVYFLIDTRYIVFTGFKGIDGVEMTDLENMCSGPKENETFEDGYMQPLQIAVAIKTDAARAACDGSFVLRVGLKAIAEGTTDPAEWTSCMLGSYPTGVGYTVVADVDNANGAEFGWTVNVVGEGSGDSSEEDSSEPEPTPNEYTVTFVDINGDVIKTETVVEGGAATAPTAPTVAGYDFTGWDKAFDNVTGDITVQAIYTIKSYTVTWVVDGKSTSETYDYGATPTFKGTTDKAATAQYTYTFAGWDKAIAKVTGNATYTAKYTSTVNKYTITWNNYDGKPLATDTVAYGETPVYTGATPVKPADATTTYTFAGWDKTIAKVTGDATYTATFTAGDAVTYTITFVDEDGTTVLKTENVAYGALPTAPAAPTKAATAQYTYTFNGWDKEIVKVTGNATYKATYEATVNQYTVTFVVGAQGTTGDKLVWTVDYGTASSAITVPTVTASGAAYEFTGWDKAVPATITGNVTITAQFKTTGSAVNVTFVGGANGTLIGKDDAGNTVVLAAGETLTIAVPSGAAAGATFNTPDVIADENYSFAGWYVGDELYDHNSILEGDITLTAKFVKNAITIDSFSMDAVGTMGYANAYLYVTLNDDVLPENVQVVTFYQTEDGRTNITIDKLDLTEDASGNYYIQMAVAPGSYDTFDVYLIDGAIDFSAADWNVIDVYTNQVIA